MGTSEICILITIILYLSGMVMIGVFYSRRNKDVGDYYLGGRKLGPLVSAMSAEASDMSSYLLMGLPGLAYFTGLAEAGWTIIGLAVGTYLNWLIVAKRLRVYSQKTNSITIPDFFADRFHDKSGIIMGISAVIIIVFFVPYSASGFSACGKLFQTLFGANYHVAMIISAIVIISYTMLGGFSAASFTDLIQSIVMTLALIIIVVYGVNTAGGLSNVVDNAKSVGGYFSLTSIYDPETGGSNSYSFLQIASTLAWGLGYFGMPHILLRFMAIKDKKNVKLSRRIASVWVVIAMSVAIFIGFIGSTLSTNGTIEKLTTSADSETVIMKIATVLSDKGVIFALAAGLIFAGILACTMSTADSQLLAASSSMSENIIKGVFKVKISEKMSMITARMVLIAIAILGVIFAWDPDSSVFRIVSFAWAGFGATFGPLMLCSLFWKRTNKWGAICGLVSGGVMVFVWKFVISKLGGVFTIYELLPAFIIALVVTIVVSLATAAPEQEIIDEFNAVKEEMKAE